MALNKYIAIYRNKQLEVEATTTYEAWCKAAATFKAKKRCEVTVFLIEKNGEEVVHDPAILD